MRTPFFGDIGQGPWVTVVWGDSRAAVHRVSYAIAHEIDPGFAWLDICNLTDEPLEPGPVELGWIPDGRLFITKRPSEARPQRPVSPGVIWQVVRSDNPEHELATFRDFLQLPEVTQKIVSMGGPASGRRAVVFGNAERVREYYPKSLEEIRPFFAAEVASGLVPIYGVTGPSGPARMAADCVFEVQTPDLRHWREGALHCEKAPSGASFLAGDRTPLTSEPIASTFTRDRDWK